MSSAKHDDTGNDKGLQRWLPLVAMEDGVAETSAASQVWNAIFGPADAGRLTTT